MNGIIDGHNIYERADALTVKIKTDETVFAEPGLFLLGVAFCAALFVSGCSKTGAEYAIAPPPSAFDYTAHTMTEAAMPAAMNISAPSRPAVKLGAPDQPVLAAGKTSGAKPCRAKDRFDRDAAIAYHWGDTQRHRMAFDVQGMNAFGGEVEGLEVRYTMRLQRYKTKKERCRYDSNWQGLIGSGYHEMFLREEDTVWQELRDVRNDVETRLDTLFDW